MQALFTDRSNARRAAQRAVDRGEAPSIRYKVRAVGDKFEIEWLSGDDPAAQPVEPDSGPGPEPAPRAGEMLITIAGGRLVLVKPDGSRVGPMSVAEYVAMFPDDADEAERIHREVCIEGKNMGAVGGNLLPATPANEAAIERALDKAADRPAADDGSAKDASREAANAKLARDVGLADPFPIDSWVTVRVGANRKAARVTGREGKLYLVRFESGSPGKFSPDRLQRAVAPAPREPAPAPARRAAPEPHPVRTPEPRKIGRPKSAPAPVDVAGGVPAAPTVTSPANVKAYQPRFDKLHALAAAGDWAGVEGYAINGVNSYAKMLQRYKTALLSYRTASAAAAA